MIEGTAITEEECKLFFDQWQALADARIMPHTTDFLHDPDPELISYVHIIELVKNGQLIRFMGTGLVDLWSEDRTNQILVQLCRKISKLSLMTSLRQSSPIPAVW